MKKLLAHNWFFLVTVSLFAVASLWIASASLYPMAFDEEWHLALIKLYAEHPWPYGIQNTNDMAVLGAAGADASYLFHYLMSFPYQILSALGLSEQTMIIGLRFINVSFVIVALFLYRRLLLAFGLSRSAAHLVLALFTLIPIMPMLAGQINYDNLLFVIVAGAALLTNGISQAIWNSKKIPALSFWLLVIVCLFGAAVKYAFLPIMLAIGLWLVGLWVWSLKSRRWKAIRGLWNETLKLQRWTLALLLLGVAAGLFFSARYVVSYVQYGSPIAKCEQVFEDKNACRAYGPWGRDKLLEETRDPAFVPKSFPSYIAEYWLPGMTKRLFFTLSGPTNDYQTKEPLPVPYWTFVVLVAGGSIALLVRLRSIIEKYPIFLFVALAVGLYLVPLTAGVYESYVKTGEPVAINGRYLLPFVPLIGAILITALIDLGRAYRPLRQLFAPLVVICLLLIVTQGGGAGTYIALGESAWFWEGWGQTSHAFLQSAVSSVLIID